MTFLDPLRGQLSEGFTQGVVATLHYSVFGGTWE
jgi:hypothetical protein